MFKMIGAGRAHFHSQASGACAGELVGMDARRQSADKSRAKDVFGLQESESSAIAENIIKLCQTRVRHVGDPDSGDEIGIVFRMFAVFGRDHMRAQKSCRDVERLLESQFAHDFESLDFVREIEAVAGLGFERRRAMRGEISQARVCTRFQVGRGGGSQFSNAGKDAAARFRDLLVGCARDALLVLGRAAFGEDQVSMRVDEARHNDAAADIDFLRAPRFPPPFDHAPRPRR